MPMRIVERPSPRPTQPATVTLPRQQFRALVVLGVRRALEQHTFARWTTAFALRLLVAHADDLGDAERAVLRRLLAAHPPDDVGGSVNRANGTGVRELWRKALAKLGG
jgi:hypothetical protein